MRGFGHGLYSFRNSQYTATPRKKIGFALGCLTVFGVLPLLNFLFLKFAAGKLAALAEASGGVFTVGSELYERYRFYLSLMSSVGFVSEWIRIIALPIFLIIAISWIRTRKENAIPR